MPNKKIKVSECCIITNDDKGQRSLVGKAKEALTTLAKNKVDVTIILESTPKEAAETFLKQNNVPYKSLIEQSALSGLPAEDKKFDATILGESNIILHRGDWQWTLDNLVDVLYRKSEQPVHKSEQQKMDEKFADYKHWADESNKAAAKRKAASGDVIGG